MGGAFVAAFGICSCRFTFSLVLEGGASIAAYGALLGAAHRELPELPTEDTGAASIAACPVLFGADAVGFWGPDDTPLLDGAAASSKEC